MNNSDRELSVESKLHITDYVSVDKDAIEADLETFYNIICSKVESLKRKYPKDEESIDEINLVVTDALDKLERELQYIADQSAVRDSHTTWSNVYDLYDKYFRKIRRLTIS